MLKCVCGYQHKVVDEDEFEQDKELYEEYLGEYSYYVSEQGEPFQPSINTLFFKQDDLYGKYDDKVEKRLYMCPKCNTIKAGEPNA